MQPQFKYHQLVTAGKKEHVINEDLCKTVPQLEFRKINLINIGQNSHNLGAAGYIQINRF